MVRNIRYKPITKDLEKMVKPNSEANIRPSLGLEKSVGEFFYISVDDLIPFKNQARISFDDEEILLLAESIKKHDMRQPLTIIPSGNKYEVISGERRLRAAKIAGLNKVPCIIVNDNSQAEAIALIENIHRKDLTPLELGIAYKNLIENKIFASQTEITEKIAVTKSQVSEYIKYAEFDSEIQNFIIDNKITSRDKLREALKSYNLGDTDKVKRILGMNITERVNFSVLRIALNAGQMKFQKQGIKKLSPFQKTQLKNYLIEVIGNL